MDKKTFINELRQALSVLQEEELNDMVSEYEQHIDMKQANGLTEEEAIADFGSLSQLTAEILEAYHVRADYAAVQKEAQGICHRRGIGAGGLRKGGRLFAAGWKLAKDSAARMGKWLWATALCGKRAAVRSFAWAKGRWKKYFGLKKHGKEGWGDMEDGRQGNMAGELAASHKGSRAGEAPSKAGACFQGIGKCMAGAARLAISACLWAARILWNGICITFALSCAFAGAWCLFALGMLAVLLLQGYPLAGVAIGCGGLVMCCFSLAWLGLTLLWKRERDNKGGRQRTTREKGQIAYHETEEGQHA